MLMVLQQLPEQGQCLVVALCSPSEEFRRSTSATGTRRFNGAADTTARGQRMRGIQTAELKEGETFTYSKGTNLLRNS